MDLPTDFAIVKENNEVDVRIDERVAMKDDEVAVFAIDVFAKPCFVLGGALGMMTDESTPLAKRNEPPGIPKVFHQHDDSIHLSHLPYLYIHLEPRFSFDWLKKGCCESHNELTEVRTGEPLATPFPSASTLPFR